MTISIRSVSEGDAAAIAEVLDPLIEAGAYTVMDERLGVDGVVEFIRAFPARGVFHVAVSDDRQQLLGLQDVVPIRSGERAFEHVGEISTFVTLGSHRQGIGRRLCQATLPEAVRRGFSKIIATVRADNPRAVAFYQSQGFEIIGTACGHAFVGGQYLDEVLMERFID